MANTVLSTTYKTTTAIGQREDLTNMIYDLSPTETPFSSMIAREPVTAVLHEWQTTSLATASTTNVQIEGLNYTEFATVSPTTRVGNYVQILNKLVSVSGTLDAVSKAGRSSESSFQTLRKLKEIKRDLEATMLNNQAGAARVGVTSGAYMATMGAWIKTNTSISTTSSGNPVYTTGVPAAARTDGTARALSETLFKAVLQSCATSGADPTVAMFGVVNKGNASKFAGIATKTQVFDTSKAVAMPIIGASDMVLLLAA
jgi:hypothetical protein